MLKGFKENVLLEDKIHDYEKEIEFSSEPLKQLEVYYDPEKWPSLGDTK